MFGNGDGWATLGAGLGESLVVGFCELERITSTNLGPIPVIEDSMGVSVHA